MKSILFLCLVVAATGMETHNVHLSQSQKDRANQHIMECVKQTGVKPEVLSNAKKGQFADDEALKKFTLCFFQKSGILDNDAKLNIETALSKLPPGVNKTDAAKVLEECKSKTGKDAPDTAFEIFKCYSQGTKQHVLV